MNQKAIFLVFAAIFFGTSLGLSQVGINTDGSTPDASAMLDVKSSNLGLLLPRMTNAERDGISPPAIGLIIFNTEALELQVFDGTFWRPLTMGSCSPPAPGSITGNTMPVENSMGEPYSISEVLGASGYTWTVPSGSTIVSGQGTVSITVNFGVTDGNVSVRSESGCGVSSYTDLAISLESLPTCYDLIQNGNETGVDCGGPDCNPCCTNNSDCDSGICIGGICQDPTCSDGIQNGNETGVDCGGPDCNPCCTNNSDCDSGICIEGICQDPTCSDGIQNGNETGVDCGGPDCNPCCTNNSDCDSGICIDGICQDPTCSDGIQNGNETGVDCGGPDCDPC